jgi:hypothetical protein
MIGCIHSYTSWFKTELFHVRVILRHARGVMELPPRLFGLYTCSDLRTALNERAARSALDTASPYAYRKFDQAFICKLRFPLRSSLAATPHV